MVVLSNTFGRPGDPGTVQVSYLDNLRKGAKFPIPVRSPGIGGTGGPVAYQGEPAPDLDNLPDTAADFSHRGGAGGGRENLPLIEALSRYAELIKGTEREPLCFMEPGEFEVEWPYDTATATVVMVNPGGGGWWWDIRHSTWGGWRKRNARSNFRFSYIHSGPATNLDSRFSM